MLPESGMGVLPHGFTQKNGQTPPYEDIIGKHQYGADLRTTFSQRRCGDGLLPEKRENKKILINR
jgi:hypothetical protein